MVENSTRNNDRHPCVPFQPYPNLREANFRLGTRVEAFDTVTRSLSIVREGFYCRISEKPRTATGPVAITPKIRYARNLEVATSASREQYRPASSLIFQRCCRLTTPSVMSNLATLFTRRTDSGARAPFLISTRGNSRSFQLLTTRRAFISE